MAIERVEAACRRSLGTAVKHALKSTRLVQTISPAGGPSRKCGTHRNVVPSTRCIDEVGALRSDRVVLSTALDHYYDPLRLPLGCLSLPVRAVIDRRACRAAGAAPRRLSPVPRTTFCTFHAPYAGGFLGTRSRNTGTFHGLRRCVTGSASPCALTGMHNDAADFASCCGPRSCHPLHGMKSLRFDGDLSIDAGSQLPGTLASPGTGLTPAGHPELAAWISYVISFLSLTTRPSLWTHHTCAFRLHA